MSGQCSHQYCHPDGICAMGEMDRSKCVLWKSSDDGHSEETGLGDSGFSFLPWNGHLIGSDISIVAARGRPILIALLGAHKAGKTTFLITAYASLRLGGQLAIGEFAGSYTIAAWEELSAWTRPTSRRPGQFPPRTSSKSRESAGLLHLAVRTNEGTLRDILFTDAPGEWFQDWALRADAKRAESARWIAENADAFLLFADSDKLAGEDRGVARGEVTDLIGRLSTVLEKRPVGLLWAKSDIDVMEPIQRAIHGVQERQLPNANKWKASYTKPDTVLKVVSDIINLAVQPQSISRIVEPVAETSPFLAFRG